MQKEDDLNNNFGERDTNNIDEITYANQQALDLKSEEFQDFKICISNYLKIEENNSSLEEQISMLEYISSCIRKLTKETFDNAFDEETISFFVDRFIESASVDLRMSLLIDILSEIVWFITHPLRMVEDDFIDKITDCISHSSGDIKRSASNIFYCLVQFKIWNDKITASQNIQIWDNIDDIDIKLESFGYLVYEKDSLIDYNIILNLLQSGVNLFINSTNSCSLNIAMEGFRYYLDLNQEWTRKHPTELSEIFHQDFMLKLADLSRTDGCSKNSIRLFNDFITYKINDQQIFENIIPIIEPVLFSEDSTENMKSSIFYFWSSCLSKGCKYFGESGFTQNIMNELNNSPFKVKKAALTLLYTAYQYNPDLTNELNEDNFEIFFEMIEQADELILDDVILILTRILDYNEYSNPEITRHITDYDELETLKDHIHEIEMNPDFDEETHEHARILLDFLDNKQRSYERDFDYIQ